MRLQSNAGSGQRSQGGQGGTGAGLQLPAQGLGLVGGVAGLLLQLELASVPVPVPATPVPVPPFGDAGNIRDFNIYKSASVEGIFAEVIPLMEPPVKL